MLTLENNDTDYKVIQWIWDRIPPETTTKNGNLFWKWSFSCSETHSVSLQWKWNIYVFVGVFVTERFIFVAFKYFPNVNAIKSVFLFILLFPIQHIYLDIYYKQKVAVSILTLFVSFFFYITLCFVECGWIKLTTLSLFMILTPEIMKII